MEVTQEQMIINNVYRCTKPKLIIKQNNKSIGHRPNNNFSSNISACLKSNPDEKWLIIHFRSFKMIKDKFLKSIRQTMEKRFAYECQYPDQCEVTSNPTNIAQLIRIIDSSFSKSSSSGSDFDSELSFLRSSIMAFVGVSVNFDISSLSCLNFVLRKFYYQALKQ